MKPRFVIITFFLLNILGSGFCPAHASILEELSTHLQLSGRWQQRVKRIFDEEAAKLLKLKQSTSQSCRY